MSEELRTVYRIQDARGLGPWKPGFSHLWCEERTEEEEQRLPPWYLEFGRVDRFALYGMGVGCGCVSVEQLMRWFRPSEYRRLLDLGHRAVLMPGVRILAESEIQCVFERAGRLSENVEPFELYPAESETGVER